MAEDSAVDPHVQTSVTSSDGRTLTGIGVSAEALEATIDRHEPDEAEPKKSLGTKLVDAVIADRAPQTQEPPQLAKGRARYSALTHERDAEKARADAAEKKAQELEARLSQAPAMPNSGMSAAEIRATVTPEFLKQQASAPPPTRPKPSEDEVGTKYAVYADFVEDLNDWKDEQRQATIDQRIRQSIDADRQQQAFTAQVEQTRVKGRAVYADFDAVLSGPAAAVTAPMPPQAQAFIWQQPNAEHLVYAILKDPALAQRLTWLSVNQPHVFGLELAKLAPTGNGNGHRERPATSPPAPMQPVGAGSRTTVPTSADHADAGDYQAYKKARAAERGGR